MKGSKTAENDRKGGQPVRCTPPIVLPGAWEAARQEMLVKEKGLMRARDALAAERRRMPWMAVEKAYEFEGPKGKVSLLDLFQGRRQLSMMLWRWTGDLLLYGWVQFFPGVALPLLFLVFPPRYSGTFYWLVAVLLYAVAKLFEFADHAVYRSFILSGHTLKHLFAAVACFAILRYFQKRRPIA